jgi:hypothetical protein
VHVYPAVTQDAVTMFEGSFSPAAPASKNKNLKITPGSHLQQLQAEPHQEAAQLHLRLRMLLRYPARLCQKAPSHRTHLQIKINTCKSLQVSTFSSSRLNLSSRSNH